jgi:hypothetical protein
LHYRCQRSPAFSNIKPKHRAGLEPVNCGIRPGAMPTQAPTQIDTGASANRHRRQPKSTQAPAQIDTGASPTRKPDPPEADWAKSVQFIPASLTDANDACKAHCPLDRRSARHISAHAQNSTADWSWSTSSRRPDGSRFILRVLHGWTPTGQKRFTESAY